MLAVVHEYLAECQRQRLQPFEGFINHLDACSIDADLDGVPLQSIRVFALALSRVGLDAPRAPPRRPPSDPPSSSLVFSAGKGAAGGKANSRGKGASRGLSSSRGAGSSCRGPSPPRALTGRLVRLRLRFGRRPVQALGKRLREGGRRKEKEKGKEAGKRGEGRALANSPAVFPVGGRVLAELVDGVRRAVELSRDSLVDFEFAGFPLRAVPEGAGRLMRALAACAPLRALSLHGSALSPGLFSALTTAAARPFSRLAEASFAACGLTDACGRGLRALVCRGRAAAGAADWRRSLRSPAGPSKSPPREGGGLARLDVSDNALGDPTLRVLAETLRGDASMRFLDFSRNAASREGLRAFVLSGVLEDSALESVDFSHNVGITDSCRGGVDGCERENALPFLQFPHPLEKAFLLVHHGIEQCLLLRQHGEGVSGGGYARSSPSPVRINTSTPRAFQRSNGNDIPTKSTEAFYDNPLLQTLPAAPETSSRHPHPQYYVHPPHSCAFHPPNATHPTAVDSSRTAADTINKGPSQGYSGAIPPSSPPFLFNTAVGGEASPRMAGASFPWMMGGGAETYGYHHPSPYYPPFLYMMPVMAMPSGGVSCPRCGIILPSKGEHSPLPPQMHEKFSAGFTESAPLYREEKPYSYKEAQKAPLNSVSFSGPDGMVHSPTTKSYIAVPDEPRAASGDSKRRYANAEDPPAGEDLRDIEKEEVREEDAGDEDPTPSDPNISASLAKFPPPGSEEIPHKGSLEKDLQHILRLLTYSMEHQEMQLTEKLEKHHQQTTSRLDAFRRDLVEKISHVSQHQREMENHLIQQLESSKESMMGDWQKDENQLLNELTSLIQAGMERVKRQMGVSDEEKPRRGEVKSLLTADTQRLRYSAQKDKISLSEAADRRGDFLSEINIRLKALGW